MQHTERGFQITDEFEKRFLFHGDASGASGQIHSIGGRPVNLVSPVHGQSSLPLIGGISRSRVEGSLARFADFFQYGLCETFAEGKVVSDEDGERAEVVISAAVHDVRVRNRPAHQERPGVNQVEFHADRIAIAMKSVYRRGEKASFQIMDPVEDNVVVANPTIVIHGEREVQQVPLRLTFDVNRAAYSNGGQYDEESRMQTPNGWLTSIVTSVQRDDERAMPGHVLSEAGLGRIYFGEALCTEFSTQITMVRVRLGSQNTGCTTYVNVGPNGVWPRG